MVDPPSVEDTIAILRGLKDRYETHHGVRITDSALVAAATLSNRYITDRWLPDKAIDLIDEAASKLRIENDSLPAELDGIRRRIMQLQIEREALKKETDPASKERLKNVEKQLADLEEKNRDADRPVGDGKRRDRSDQGPQAADRRGPAAVRGRPARGDLERAARLKYETIANLQEGAADRRRSNWPSPRRPRCSRTR